MFEDNDMLMLSGIQHFMFCPRQWALIHIEQQWEDNRLTAEGTILHTHVDNPLYRQKNGNIITLRSVAIASKELGLYGITDAIELHPSDNSSNSITHHKYPGYWQPFPIEYKRGHKKPDERDIVQVVAQAMCLEEMYNIQIPSGALFYGETRHRETIEITKDLRTLVKSVSNQMHSILKSGKLPGAKEQKHCRNCSLINICMPQLSKYTSASEYLKLNLYEKTS